MDSYRIDEEDGELVIRIPGGVLDRDRLSQFLDYLALESVRQKSKLTEEQACEIADEIDAAAWARVRSLFES